MEAKALNAFKEGFGFNIYTNQDPDLITWLYDKWIKSGEHNQESIDAVTKYANFCKEVISQQPVVGMEYLDNGIGVLLSNGERIPFNKNSTIVAPVGSVSITGTTATITYNQGQSIQLNTSAPITGGK